jgi:amidase
VVVGWRWARIGLLATVVVSVGMAWAPGTQAPPFRLQEITISELHAALRDRRTTCRAVVESYLRRIDAHDKRGAAINALISVNDGAAARARELDRIFEESGLVGPLHCVPMVVKDNYETLELPTSAGSLSLEGMTTGKDAFVVARLRAAGAILLAKANMHEFAFSQYETVSSILPGYTRNPYDLHRVTAGSSGGTAAAVAANFALVGLGTDTGASIRGPASFQALVGIRPSMGLTSRTGVVPVFLDSDVTGPMTRTVADAAAILQVMAGEDPEDQVTVINRGKPEDYGTALDAKGLRGARIGVIRQIYESPSLDPEIATLFARALDDIRRAGADVEDPVAIEGLDALRGSRGGPGCNRFKFDLNGYLSGLGPKAPMHSLEEIVASSRFHPTIRARLESSEMADDVPGKTEGCKQREARRAGLREAVLKMMAARRLDALVYPTWSNPPRLIGDLNTPHGDNNQLLAPSTGFPAITVPMGFTTNGTLPAGLQFFGRAWSESTLIRLAYAYEQATRHRRPPVTTPE